MNMSLRRFHGWTGVGSEWDDEQRNLMRALAQFRADSCPGCAQPMSESTLPANEFAYSQPPPLRCHACTPQQVAQRGYREGDPEEKSGPHGAVYWPQPRRKEGGQ